MPSYSRGAAYQATLPRYRASYDLRGSVANLPAALTINGVTVLPSFRYNAADAGPGGWPADGYGSPLVRQAGTAPTYNAGSPLMGRRDDSVQFNAGGFYQLAAAGIGNVTTEDWVLELVYRPKLSGAACAIIGTYDGAGHGWLVYDANGTQCACYTNSKNVWLQAVTASALYHFMLFHDTSGSALGYLNGVAGTPVAATGASLTSTTALYVGGGWGTAFSERIYYAALWKRATWLDSHLQPTTVAQRFALLNNLRG